MKADENEERISIISEHQKKGKQLILEQSKTREGVVTNVRLPRGIVASIDEWVNLDMFRSRSDFLATAARHYLCYLSDKNIMPQSQQEGMSGSDTESSLDMLDE